MILPTAFGVSNSFLIQLNQYSQGGITPVSNKQLLIADEVLERLVPKEKNILKDLDSL